MRGQTWATSFCVMLAVVGLRAVPQQPAPASPHPCLTAQRENYGREWSTQTRGMRETYVYGFIDGQSGTFLKMEGDVPPERREPLRLETFMFYDVDAIAGVMTDLYRDAANTYIRYDAMIYIARNKLAGRDIEANLRSSRQKDCGLIPPSR